jgi:hypothetical protein
VIAALVVLVAPGDVELVDARGFRARRCVVVEVGFVDEAEPPLSHAVSGASRPRPTSSAPTRRMRFVGRGMCLPWLMAVRRSGHSPIGPGSVPPSTTISPSPSSSRKLPTR